MSPSQEITVVPPPAETGFAALEAKVEEVQSEASAAVEYAEGTPAAAGAKPGDPPTAGSVKHELSFAGPPLTSVVAPAAWMNAYMAWIQDGMRAQAVAFARFTEVRDPADLLAAQMTYARTTLEVCLSGMGRMATAARQRA